MLQRIKNHLPETIKKPVRRALMALREPELPYLELHLTDHCNLNCKGCGHYCPIASPNYADIKQHERDMRRLSELFHNIRMIRLMGGEPLLHPQPASFIAVTRRFFPQADIRLVTNGILLPNASDIFWRTCRDTHTTIDLTVYPPLRSRIEDFRALCKSWDVCLNAKEVELFHAHMNLSGNSDERRAFSICRDKYYCPFLQNNHLYPCAKTALIHYFNERFNYHIPVHSGVDIHSHFPSGRKVLQLLNRPISTCKYCSYDFVPFVWTKSCQMSSEWDAEAQKNFTEQAAALDEE